MHETWQNAVVLSVVALAAIYLAVRAVGVLRRKKAGCGGGCSGCVSSAPAQSPRLVSIGLAPSEDRPRKQNPL